MSVVKIFLPRNLFDNKNECKIFGEIQITENSISYFVISDENRNELRHLGYITPSGKNVNKDVSMNFSYDALSSSIYLTKLSIKTSNTTVPNIFLYKADEIIQLYSPDQEICKLDQYPSDVRMLYNLLVSFSTPPTKPHQKQAILPTLFTFACESVHCVFSIVDYKPISLGFSKMALGKHYDQWKVYKSSRKRLANILMDKFLGLIVMIVLLFFIAKPGDDLIQVFHFVIYLLRQLLLSLKGSPIGLKLNVHLNNFLLDCFTYHVDLWDIFLDLIEPIVRRLFVPIALLGLMGLSFQIALLADLISLVSLHGHSFYIYTAVLYRIEIKGLRVLWHVVLGKRRNPLTDRLESHEYMNRQLFLATIFFASLMFLLPTVIIYYAVFTSLRLAIYIATMLLKIIQRQIIEFPLETIINWSLGRFYEIDSLDLQYIELPIQRNCMKMSIFEINVKSSSLSRVFACQAGFLKDVKTNEDISPKVILKKVLKGTF